MIQHAIDRFNEKKAELSAKLHKKHPEEYADLVKLVVETLTEDTYEVGALRMDPNRIHEIDDGDYQGTLIYIIAENGYQPDRYWSTCVSYGSCSGCDTLLGINQYDTTTPPTDAQVEDYLTLALHLVQHLRQICGYEVED